MWWIITYFVLLIVSLLRVRGLMAGEIAYTGGTGPESKEEWALAIGLVVIQPLGFVALIFMWFAQDKFEKNERPIFALSFNKVRKKYKIQELQRIGIKIL